MYFSLFDRRLCKGWKYAGFQNTYSRKNSKWNWCEVLPKSEVQKEASCLALEGPEAAITELLMSELWWKVIAEHILNITNR